MGGFKKRLSNVITLTGFAGFLVLTAHIHTPVMASGGDNGVSLLKQIASSETLNTTREILFDVWKRGGFQMDLAVRAFYEEVSGHSEFPGKGGGGYFQRKWEGSIPFVVWPSGDEHQELNIELAKIVQELNIYMETAQLIPAERSEDVKLWVILGDEESFLQLAPKAEQYLESSDGIATCSLNRASKIMTRCVAYVDTEKSVSAQKHALREEVTQSLGLMNDSPEYPDSIFYSKYSSTTHFSYRDVWSIYELYRSE